MLRNGRVAHAFVWFTPHSQNTLQELAMLDRYTARALVETGQMSSEEYLRLFGEELRAARDQLKAEREAQMRDLAAQARQKSHASARIEDN
jgi:hypothetical protein